MLGEQARKGPKPGGKVGQDREMMTAAARRNWTSLARLKPGASRVFIWADARAAGPATQPARAASPG